MKPLPESKYAVTGNIADMNDFTRDQVLAIQKQAYEDGLRDAGKDAERYQWLRTALADRSRNGKSHWICCIQEGQPEDLDADIDAAMLTASQKEPQ